MKRYCGWVFILVLLAVMQSRPALAESNPGYALGFGVGVIRPQITGPSPLVGGYLHLNMRRRLSLEIGYEQWWKNQSLDGIVTSRTKESILLMHLIYRVILFHNSAWTLGTGIGFHFISHGVFVRQESRSDLNTRLGLHYFSELEIPVRKTLFLYFRGRFDVVASRGIWLFTSGVRYNF